MAPPHIRVAPLILILSTASFSRCNRCKNPLSHSKSNCQPELSEYPHFIILKLQEQLGSSAGLIDMMKLDKVLLRRRKQNSRSPHIFQRYNREVTEVYFHLIHIRIFGHREHLPVFLSANFIHVRITEHAVSYTHLRAHETRH